MIRARKTIKLSNLASAKGRTGTEYPGGTPGVFVRFETLTGLAAVEGRIAIADLSYGDIEKIVGAIPAAAFDDSSEGRNAFRAYIDVIRWLKAKQQGTA